jgi:hypothetical protein
MTYGHSLRPVNPIPTIAMLRRLLISAPCVLAVVNCATNPSGKARTAITPPSGQAASALSVPTGFPASCAPDEVRVMLLGTYHFANPGLDEVKQQVDDVLASARQKEIGDLVEKLARWRPDQIAVEWSTADSAALHAQYGRYRSGLLDPSRSEVVQVGFRLAARLGLPTVEAIDVKQPFRLGNDSAGPLLKRRPDLKEIEDRVSAELQRESDSHASAFAKLSIVNQLAELNGDASLHAGNSRGMFGALLPLGEGTNYGGPQVLARWYERNFIMVHHLYRSLRPDTRRVLVIVGAGHVPPMRNVLDEAPQFCPVSPLPYLAAE